MPRRSITGCRAIVTGASSGIGQSLASQLYASGAELVITARRASRLQTLINEIQVPDRKIHALPGDVTDPTLRQSLVETAVAELGGLDMVVNNAGSGAFGPFAEADRQRLRRIMEVNFFAPVELIRLALPELKQGNRPVIVNISSVLGHCAVPDKSEYCASKFALHGFTDALREELASQGVDVLLVSPSTTDSEFFTAIDKPADGDMHVSSLKMSPHRVARQTVAAIRRGRREVILSGSGKLLVWSDRLAPGMVSWFLSRGRDE